MIELALVLACVAILVLGVANGRPYGWGAALLAVLALLALLPATARLLD